MTNTFKTVLIGLGATFLIDCWTFLLKLMGIKSQGLVFIGRWIAYMKEGKFAHDTIIEAPGSQYELLVGWLAHYVVGVSFAFLLVLLYGKHWINKPTMLPAMIVVLATFTIPVFFVQPALGFGIAFSNMPHQYYLLLRLFLIHVVYGVGLFLTAKAMQTVSYRFKHVNRIVQ